MNDLLVTVIIPVYNAEKYLNECLDSIINQSYKNIEIIIINDGSIDSSLDICEEYAKKDKRIRLINQINSGPSCARNAGLKLSTGDYILFVDSDDYIENDMILKMIKKAIIYEYDLIICSYNIIENNKKTQIFIEKKDCVLDYLIKSKSLGYPWAKMIKKSAIKKGFDENLFYLEDINFWIDNINYIKKHYLINEGLYNYRVVSTSLLNSNKYSIRKKSIFKACEMLINKIPNDYQYIYILIYLSNYYLYRNYLSNDLYITYKRLYYRAIKDRKIKIYIKIKLLIKHVIILTFRKK